MLEVHYVELAKLKPWEDNPRLNDHAVDAVAKSIEHFGFNVPILCDENLTIIAGHTRWKAAGKLGMNSVPVILVPLTDTQRRAFPIADNKTAEIAEWDFPRLRDVLEQLRSEEVDLGELGFSDNGLRRLLCGKSVDEDHMPETEAEPETKSGDLWILGRHRLLCGDSRDKSYINLLTEGRQVDHVFAGPPYFNQREYAIWDNYEEYLLDMKKVVENCRHQLKDGGVIVWNIANDCSSHYDLASEHSRILRESGLLYLDTIAWVKSGGSFTTPRNFHIRRNRCYYPAFQWESLLVFQKPGEMPRMTSEAVAYMLSYQTNVWEIPAVTHQLEQYRHPAVCPVEIPYRCILAYTGDASSAFEPFGGSGTTLIAAEKAGREAYLMERVPEYCDQIVNRWENFTGEKAERLERALSDQEEKCLN